MRHTTFALLLLSLVISGCERAYDFDRDIVSKATGNETRLFDVDYQIDKRLALFPENGVIKNETKSCEARYGNTRERQVKFDREQFGKLLTIYYWKVEFQKETISPGAPGLRGKETWDYTVYFKVSDKKKPNENRAGSQQVDLGPGTPPAGETKASSSDSMLVGIYECASPMWVLQLKSDGSYLMEALDSGNRFQGNWTANGKSGVLKPTTGASLTFTAEGKDAVVIDKYGYRFLKTR